jgi:NADH-quinone oxidoreductase subunit M
MFLIIGIWGGKRPHLRVLQVLPLHAARLGADAGRDDGDVLGRRHHGYRAAAAHQFSAAFDLPAGRSWAQTWLWLAFFASFAVKMPMWPVHTWLPDAHVQAPTAGLGHPGGDPAEDGRLRLPALLAADVPGRLRHARAAGLLWLSVIAIIYTSLVALVQEDMKKLIAYSSVAHMGFVTMGIFAANQQGVDGAIFQMLSHGFVSGALFLCVGVIYDRMHTREIDAYGGLVNRMPAYAVAFMLFTMANVGLPGTSGFVGEFLTLMGVFQVNTWVGVLAATGVILSAGYALWLYRRVVFGDLIKESLKSIRTEQMPSNVTHLPDLCRSCRDHPGRRCDGAADGRRLRPARASATVRLARGA